jgi:hypothetical protein
MVEFLGEVLKFVELIFELQVKVMLEQVKV